MKRQQKGTAKTKKQYVKPEIRKNKPVAVVSGSCSTYVARAYSGSYYH
jgi:hypothetical protein